MDNNAELKHTSSLNKYFICNYCNKQTTTKQGLAHHIEVCLSDRSCPTCNIVFKNHGNLVMHQYYIHAKERVKNKEREKSVACNVCGKQFATRPVLKFHQREAHYNLRSKEPLAIQKDIRDKWYEKVLNTDAIIHITKVGQNILLLKKYVRETPVSVEESKEVVDTTALYPIEAENSLLLCDICDKLVPTIIFNKHYLDIHGRAKVHTCDKCNATFKRPIFFARHKCNVSKRNSSKMSINIAKIESLSPTVV